MSVCISILSLPISVELQLHIFMYMFYVFLLKKKHSTTSPELIGAGVSAREIVMDNVIDDDVPSSGNVPSRCPEPFSPFY